VSKEQVRVWLDDIREEPEGWLRTRTVEETIEAIEAFDVVELSLDNDLGDTLREGIEVLDWLEERLLCHEILPPPVIHAHTGNPSAGRSMRQIIAKLERHAHALKVQQENNDAV
jgi:hypothetical protein